MEEFTMAKKAELDRITKAVTPILIKYQFSGPVTVFGDYEKKNGEALIGLNLRQAFGEVLNGLNMMEEIQSSVPGKEVTVSSVEAFDNPEYRQSFKRLYEDYMNNGVLVYG